MTRSRARAHQIADTSPSLPLAIQRADLRSPEAQSLILALNAELEDRYPEEGANFFRLDAEEVSTGRGGFFIASIDGVPTGCGAVRRLEAGVAEIKRMYVARGARGRGLGRLILAELEAEARRLGMQRIVLETGPRQPEAIALYTRAGFAQIPLYGEYIDSNFSFCMAKELEPA
jgi:GNAT superfamily N-acetyltransferase